MSKPNYGVEPYTPTPEQEARIIDLERRIREGDPTLVICKLSELVSKYCVDTTPS